MTVCTIPNRPIGSEPREISKILANFDAITKVLNGEIDGASNIKAASIKTANLEKNSVTEEKLSVAVQELMKAKVSGLTFVGQSASAEVKTGEFFGATQALTATLPTETFNTPLGVYNLSAAETVKVKVKAGDTIEGGPIQKGTEISILPGQWVTFLGSGAKIWRITSGNPALVTNYQALVGRAEKTPLIPSTTLSTQVQISCFYASKGAATLIVGGVEIGQLGSKEASTDVGVSAIAGTSFLCLPNVAWEWIKEGSGGVEVVSSYMVLR